MGDLDEGRSLPCSGLSGGPCLTPSVQALPVTLWPTQGQPTSAPRGFATANAQRVCDRRPSGSRISATRPIARVWMPLAVNWPLFLRRKPRRMRQLGSRTPLRTCRDGSRAGTAPAWHGGSGAPSRRYGPPRPWCYVPMRWRGCCTPLSSLSRQPRMPSRTCACRWRRRLGMACSSCRSLWSIGHKRFRPSIWGRSSAVSIPDHAGSDHGPSGRGSGHR